jgi:hypothetical protein
MSAGTASNGSPVLTYSNTTGTTGTSQFVTSTLVTTTNSYTNILCHPNYYTTGITRTYSVSISGTGVVGGQILQKVQVVNDGEKCSTTGSIKDTLSIGNVVLNNQQVCEQISPSVTPITVVVGMSGTLSSINANNLLI